MQENLLAWRIWNIVNSRDRQITQVGAGPFPSTSVIALCELYEGTLEDFEKVMYLDSLLYKGPEGFSSDEEGLERVVKRANNSSAKVAPKPNKAARPASRKRKK